MQRQLKPKVKVVVASRQPAPISAIVGQCLLILLVFFEFHTTQTKSEKDIFSGALKYYEQNVANFVDEDLDARSEEGIQFMPSSEKYGALTADQLLKAKSNGANYTGKQIWNKAEEIRRQLYFSFS